MSLQVGDTVRPTLHGRDVGMPGRLATVVDISVSGKMVRIRREGRETWVCAELYQRADIGRNGAKVRRT